MSTENTRTLRRRRILAVVGGTAALGIGVGATLAAWTDTEWVFGGDGTGGPGIGTSAFNVEQNTSPTVAAAAWTDESDNPGGEIVFSLGASALTPGDSVYAAVALRTAADSIEGDLTLQPAVAAAGIAVDDPGGLLFAALDVRVATDDAAFTCDASAFTGAPTVIADGSLATTGGASSQTLAAESGSVQYYCFEVTLPAGLTAPPGGEIEDYMGRTIAPAWEFQAESA